MKKVNSIFETGDAGSIPVSNEVGYSNPPKNTRWKKGQSGNPSGAPRKAVSPQEQAQEILQSPIRSKNGRRLKRTRQDQMMLQSARDALTSVKAARFIFANAYPDVRRPKRSIPYEVINAVRELIALEKQESPITQSDTPEEVQHKYSQTLRIGNLIGEIEQSLRDFPLPMDGSNE